MALIALFLLIWDFFRRRAKKRRSARITGSGKLSSPEKIILNGYVKKVSDFERIEMDAQEAPAELDERGNKDTTGGRPNGLHELP